MIFNDLTQKMTGFIDLIGKMTGFSDLGGQKLKNRGRNQKIRGRDDKKLEKVRPSLQNG